MLEEGKQKHLFLYKKKKNETPVVKTEKKIEIQNNTSLYLKNFG